MLTPDQIREKIKQYCHDQDGSDLRDALQLEARILGLCEAMGADGEEISRGLGRPILESIGIKVLAVNPDWKFGV